MALQVWLPLTKDLRNQGLNGIPVTSTGTINLNDSGKLGKCYKTSNTGVIDLKYAGTQINTGSISLCGWFKFNKSELAATWSGYSFDSSHPYPTGNLIGNNSYGGVGLIWYTNSLASGATFTSLYVSCSIRSTANGARITNVATIPFDTWVHLALVFNKTTKALELWMNGELKVTSTMLDFNDAKADNLKLNYSAIWGGNGPSYSIPFYVNDVRIYDHALSKMEVKELSKGLILHYPLNRGGWGQENLFLNSGDLTLWSKESGVSVAWDSTEQMYKIIDSHSGTTSRWGIYQNFSVTPNTTYTLTIEGKKGQKTTGVGIATYESTTAWPGNIYSFTTEKTKKIYTFTSGSNHTVGRIYLSIIPGDTTTNDGWFNKPKLEIGDKATPWCPNSSDALATTMGLDGTTEYDTSGYCYNGTYSALPTVSSNTPKYNVSTFFGAYNTPNMITNDTTFLPALTNCTIAWWEYCTTTGNSLPFVGQSGSYYIGAGSSSTRLYDSNIGSSGITLYKDGVVQSTTQGTTVYHPNVFHTQNQWHHFVMTGVNLSTWTAFKINSYGSGWPVNAYLSDVRIYATVLSENDIKALYNNAAYIDSSGNIYGAVHSEV